MSKTVAPALRIGWPDSTILLRRCVVAKHQTMDLLRRRRNRLLNTWNRRYPAGVTRQTEAQSSTLASWRMGCMPILG
jgi:DNA-binding transcriptional MocR family regulator